MAKEKGMDYFLYLFGHLDCNRHYDCGAKKAKGKGCRVDIQPLPGIPGSIEGVERNLNRVEE